MVGDHMVPRIGKPIIGAPSQCLKIFVPILKPTAATLAPKVLGHDSLSIWSVALQRTTGTATQAMLIRLQATLQDNSDSTGIELPCEAIVGRNFVIDHFGGIIVSGYARFGDNCRIRNGVVVGLRRVDEPVAPVIGNNVDIGSGAKLLGPITIGDNSLIGANAVVIEDVPENSIAIGVPAVVKPRRQQSTAASDS
ncbi:serine acetyltransferase [Bradyrhizobium sp. RDT10]